MRGAITAWSRKQFVFRFEETASHAGDKFNVDEARWRSLFDAEKHGLRAIVARALQSV